MEKDLLDDDLFLQPTKKALPKIVNWTSLILLWLGIGYTTSFSIIDDAQLFLAMSLLCTSALVSYFNFSWGSKLTLGVIVLGILNLVDFFPVKLTFHFGFPVEIILLTIGIVHYFTNRSFLDPMFRALFHRIFSREEVKAMDRSRIEGFKERFSERPTLELKQLADNPRLVPEAIEAVRELIKERV
ncbi:MAG: hypothetical protein AAFP19_25370 [Bacteroidota bacterium]